MMLFHLGLVYISPLDGTAREQAGLLTRQPGVTTQQMGHPYSLPGGSAAENRCYASLALSRPQEKRQRGESYLR